MSHKLKVAICQLDIKPTFDENVKHALKIISKATSKGAQAILLPEIFVTPYNINNFKKVAISSKHSLIKKLASVSKEKKILLVAGSVVEKDKNKLYNTSFIFDNGKLLGKHRKHHLFNINIKNKMIFNEAKIFSYGKDIKTFNTRFGRIGVAICYDLRFPELLKKMALNGAKIIFAPAAFNHITGPLHWELVLRARALDSQTFLLACSPALNKKYTYRAWGHSAIIDPYGRIVKMIKSKPEILIKEIDLKLVDKVRSELPLLKETRLL